MPLTFVLLTLSICAVWWPSIRVGPKFLVPPWVALLLGAITTGLLQGYLTLLAVLWIALLGLVARLAAQPKSMRGLRTIGTAGTVLLALALALHVLPGFQNPVLIENARFALGAAPYTQYANFDKAAAGLLLLAVLCRRASTAAEYKQLGRRVLLPILATTPLVIGLAVTAGCMEPQFKLPAYTPIFLLANLLFTCVAEEAFFRGFIQERLATAIKPGGIRAAVVIFVSGLLFGIAHTAGGASYVAIASVLGFGCAYSYAIARRVEAPILTHFAFNTVHFMGFTYPRLDPC